MSQKKPVPDYFAEFNDPSEEMEEKQTSSELQEDFAKMLGESLSTKKKKLNVGDKIRGKILVMGAEEIYVEIGPNQDGSIARRDLLNEKGECPYKRDDVVELYVTQVRGTEVRLSKKPTDRNLAKDLEEAYAQNLAIPGRIVEVVKGGVRVNIKGKLAFCPISQIDVKHVETPDEYIGKSFDFKITQFAEGGRNIVVSRRKLLEAEREVGTASFLEENKDGATVTGKVTKLEKFGAFVELTPGVDGLVHISEIAWSRIADPAEVLTPGQEVTVKLLRREIVNGRPKISLSIKQAMPMEERPQAPGAGEGKSAVPANDPWAKLAVGQVIDGKVNRKEPYGLFVALEPGITGLLHQSRVSEHSEFRFEKIRVGDAVKVQIVEIRAKERQISLGLPGDADADDWKNHTPAAATSFGTLADKLRAATTKKK
ncbi:MAG: S1 RNA-binding domain-containing protein [Cryobacterium sp.]|nr:S1 RNA-binding domain-containing protein [Oligoflexia bacterium]